LNKLAIHPTTYLLILFAVLNGFIYELLLLFLIVVIHELGHVCVALSFGWRVKQVQLLPFGGVAEMEEYGNAPSKEEFWVIAAGPLMNVAMILWAFAMLQVGWLDREFIYLFIEYNLLLLVFNLLPIWPLDGGKLLELGLCLLYPYKKAIQHTLWISGGCFIVYVLILIFFYWAYFSLWIIALFLLVSQWAQWKQKPYQFMRFLLERSKRDKAGYRADSRDVISITLLSGEKVKEALERMFRHKQHYFCVINDQGEVEQIISEEEMLHLFFYKSGGDRAIGEFF
jgi:stage IV sporulation protein FB